MTRQERRQHELSYSTIRALTLRFREFDQEVAGPAPPLLFKSGNTLLVRYYSANSTVLVVPRKNNLTLWFFGDSSIISKDGNRWLEVNFVQLILGTQTEYPRIQIYAKYIYRITEIPPILLTNGNNITWTPGNQLIGTGFALGEDWVLGDQHGPGYLETCTQPCFINQQKMLKKLRTSLNTEISECEFTDVTKCRKQLYETLLDACPDYLTVPKCINNCSFIEDQENENCLRRLYALNSNTIRAWNCNGGEYIWVDLY